MDYNDKNKYLVRWSDGTFSFAGGENDYIEDSYTHDIPIYTDSKGDWHTQPYAEQLPDGNFTYYTPEWFKNTPEYQQWKDVYVPQIESRGVESVGLDNINELLSGFGNNAIVRRDMQNGLKTYGITDQGILDKVFDDMTQISAEAEGTPAQLVGVYGDKTYSASDIAREYLKLDKEQLSTNVKYLTDTVNSRQTDPNWTGSYEDQQKVAAAYTILNALNQIDDNPEAYGEEFEGLLQASESQKFQSAAIAEMGTLAADLPIINLIPRLIYGFGEKAAGRDFSMNIEEGTNRLLQEANAGGYLEGTGGSVRAGQVIGVGGVVMTNIALSSSLGNWTSSKFEKSALGRNLGRFLDNPIGSATLDFVLNDVPMDLIQFGTDLPSVGRDEALKRLGENFGQDLKVDGAFMVMGVAFGIGGAFDSLTHGALSRFSEKAALKVMDFTTNKVMKIPVIGKVWGAFANYALSAANNIFFREVRKGAVAEDSLDLYTKAQNNVTLANQNGLPVVMPMYMKAKADLGIDDDIENFVKHADDYGGISSTKATAETVDNGQIKTAYKIMDDRLPVQVKQGILDVEHLSELKGMRSATDGLISNKQADEAIEELQKRVDALPQEIKDFADKFSDLNKQVEHFMVDLGIEKQDFFDALSEDPRFEKYMTRQSLMIDGDKTLVNAGDPSSARILTEARTGNYSDTYIDPVWALNMKVQAIGMAYTWNERKQILVAAELAQGRIEAGAEGVAIANRLNTTEQQIQAVKSMTEKLDYNNIVLKGSRDFTSVGTAFAEGNKLLNLPNEISVRAVYNTDTPPEITDLVARFNRGEIAIDDTVKESVQLSDSDISAVVRNTYLANGTSATPDSLKPKGDTAGKDYYAGVSRDGVAYKYEMEC